MEDEQIIKETVSALNNLTDKNNSILRAIGIIVYNRIAQFELKKQKKIIVTIKKSSELKLSPQMVYDSYRMVRTFPKLADPEFQLPEGITITHFFECSRYKLMSGAHQIVIENALANNLSVNQMKKDIVNYKEVKTFVEKERIELLRALMIKLKTKTLEELKQIYVSL